MKFNATICGIGLILLCGCSQPVAPLDSAQTTSQQAPTTTQEASAVLPEKESDSTADESGLRPIPNSIAATISDEERPATIEAFKAKFVELFAKDPYLPFAELTYWEGADEEAKKSFMKNAQEFIYDYGDNGKVGGKDVTIFKIEDYEDMYYPNFGDDVVIIPTTTHVVGIKIQFSKSFSTSDYFAVGEHNGKFYFCRLK